MYVHGLKQGSTNGKKQVAWGDHDVTKRFVSSSTKQQF